MVDCYLGEIRLFAGVHPPANWAICDGRTLTISGNEALYSLIGTTYGGDGHSTFGLPDLRGRLPLGIGQRPGAGIYTTGQTGGAESVTVTTGELPSHTHQVFTAGANATTPTPGQTVMWANTVPPNLQYVNAAAVPGAATEVNPAADTIVPTGNSGAHPNIMPSMVLAYIIALLGQYPTSS